MMRLVAVQIDTAWEDRAKNHAKVRRLVEAANPPANSLIVLPEMFDCGFSMNTIATDPGDPSVSERFCNELARLHQIYLLAGLVGRVESGRLANEAVAFAPDGRVIHRYRKRQPFTPMGEQNHYPAGHQGGLFNWQDTSVAPFVCYDLRFPELFRGPARAGAELLVDIANWPTARTEHWLILLQARAIENQAFVLGVNRCGKDPKFSYDGASALFDPLGRKIFVADGNEQTIAAEIDPAVARSWRADFPALRDMNAP